MMRKASLFFIGGLIWALSTSSSLAAGEQWSVTHDPQSRSDGSQICQMRYGIRLPLMAITAAKGAQLLAVAASDLDAVETPRVQGAMRFSSGRSFALQFSVNKSGRAGANAVARISGSDIGSVMARIAMGGTMTLEVGNSVEIVFPIDGAAGESRAFMRCRDAL
ncbi:hypothetical protein [Roseovarius ramblicola]|uniref:Invasion associated locus B (IalB) protein n=1 Tax=Roseovarius ramblicola TaxID=2022336 RepID=A0ABV5I3M8_9RHOB